jgi:hypothetical protein
MKSGKSERQPLLSNASVEFEEAGMKFKKSPRSTEEGIFILEKSAAVKQEWSGDAGWNEKK